MSKMEDTLNSIRLNKVAMIDNEARTVHLASQRSLTNIYCRNLLN